MGKNVLILGSGGREHALAWKLSTSASVDTVYVAPGNGGTENIAYNVSLPLTNFKKLTDFVKKNGIDLSVVGPDNLLARGVVDHFMKEGHAIFGPTKKASEIEWSKAWAKKMMARLRIPTARFFATHTYKNACAYLATREMPLVIKASGLALGKGVYVCKSQEEAHDALEKLMVDRIHKEAGACVVIEDFISGKELSVHALCDGRSSGLFPFSRDYKRLRNNDAGPNTGGMGSYAPVPWISFRIIDTILRDVVHRMVDELHDHGDPFVGCLYPGVMLYDDTPYVLEYNARFGDPETQSYMPLLENDLFALLTACVEGTLSLHKLKWSDAAAVTVVLASQGYPYEYLLGHTIHGLEDLEKEEGIFVWHAGTTLKKTKGYETSGGRVLSVTAVANTYKAAHEKCYEAIQRISFEGMCYRSDIGQEIIS